MAGKLLRAMGSPEAIFNASLTELESHRLPAAVAQMIHTRQPMSAAAKELAQAQAAGIRLLTWDEPQYPQRLREICDPPPLLYVLGNIELLNRPDFHRRLASSYPLRESNGRETGPGFS
jgi:DNA processing protein